jgi:hypothetical protein
VELTHIRRWATTPSTLSLDAGAAEPQSYKLAEPAAAAALLAAHAARIARARIPAAAAGTAVAAAAAAVIAAAAADDDVPKPSEAVSAGDQAALRRIAELEVQLRSQAEQSAKDRKSVVTCVSVYLFSVFVVCI